MQLKFVECHKANDQDMSKKKLFAVNLYQNLS